MDPLLISIFKLIRSLLRLARSTIKLGFAYVRLGLAHVRLNLRWLHIALVAIAWGILVENWVLVTLSSISAVGFVISGDY